MAYKSGISYSGKKIKFNLKSRYGYKIPESEMYVPYFREVCGTCGSDLFATAAVTAAGAVR